MTPPPLTINGRFLAALPTGVHRYAAQIGGRVQESYPGDVLTLSPPFTRHRGPLLAEEKPRWAKVPGHLWEQSILAAVARRRGGRMLNLANFAPRLAGVDHVSMIHDLGPFVIPEHFRSSYAVWVRSSLAHIARTATVVVVHSRRVQAEVHEHFGRPLDEIVLAPCGVSAPFAGNRDKVVGGRRPYFLAVGTHDPRKNLDFLVRMWSKIGPRLDADLVLVGRSISNPHQATPPETGARLRHVSDPSDHELATLYAGALAVLFPSVYEGFGLPLLEGMAVGTPFLSTDVGAAAELAVDPRQLLPLDDDAWEAAIGWMAEDSASLRKVSMQRAGDFSWEASAAKVLRAVLGDIRSDSEALPSR